MSYENTSFIERVRTTVDIPKPLWERIRGVIDHHEIKSRNSLIIKALEKYLAEIEEELLDKEFARMADDEEYKSLNLRIAEEFAHSDWEAFQSKRQES